MSIARCFAVLLSFLSMTQQVYAQKFSIKRGEIRFVSNAELEIIKASSDQVRGLLDPANHQFAFAVDIKTFMGFNSELQREHFNEKYMESEKFPKATFNGKIIEQLDLSKDGTYDVRAKGDLDIHGQKQMRIIKAKVVVTGGNVKIESHFTVPLADHNISIPTIVKQKIATEIEVDFVASMSPQ